MEWLLKKVVSSFINRLLDEYVLEVDVQEVNEALLSGQVNLANLEIRRDALAFLGVYYELPLPVEVKRGVIKRCSLNIPYCNIFNQPIVVTVEDIFILVTPCHESDEKVQTELERSYKRHCLAYLFPEIQYSSTSSWNLVDRLCRRLWNSLELHMNNVHIRYEDTYSCPRPLVLGICLHSLSFVNTNHKWKRSQLDSSSTSVNKMLDIISASFYVNPESDKQRLVLHHINNHFWEEMMQKGLLEFSVNEENFQFVIHPVRCKLKMRQQLVREARVPGLLVDAVIRDAEVSFTRLQYLSLIQLKESLKFMNLKRKFIRLRPIVPYKRHSREWWQFAGNVVIEDCIKSFSWVHMKEYRRRYKEYVGIYKEYLKGKQTEDVETYLGRMEDYFSLQTLVVARMDAKLQLAKEKPSLVRSVGGAFCGWKSWLWPSAGKCDLEKQLFDVGVQRRKNGLTAILTEEDERNLAEVMGKIEGKSESEKKDDDIDRKLYLTCQNICIILKGTDVDVSVISLDSVVLSREDRYGVGYHKYSLKLESFSVEAVNAEHDLAYLVKFAEGHTSSVPCSKCSPFRGLTLENTKTAAASFQEFVKRVALNRKTLVHFDIDIKSLCFVLTEYGSLQSGGNVLIVDFGGLQINSELGDSVPEAEGATKMEIEEKLYDRFSLIVPYFQILFADSGDEWRNLLSRSDSELHVLSRVRIKVDFANSMQPSMNNYPQYKSDVHISSLKLKISDNQINHLYEFGHNFPFPHQDSSSNSEIVTVHCVNLSHCIFDHLFLNARQTFYYLQSMLNQNKEIDILDQGSSCSPSNIVKKNHSQSFDTISQTSLELQKYFQEVNSDEEFWSEPVDLPGFEDNGSPYNTLISLSRFCIDEIQIDISRSSEHGDKPYLMFGILCMIFEMALMKFGPAFQFSVGSFFLVDKYHHTLTGEYLELLSSSSPGCVVSALYRKVKANCPDFKTHFRSCEQSFILDVASVSVAWHKSAITTMLNYFSLIMTKLSRIQLKKFEFEFLKRLFTNFRSLPNDPFVPPGCVKWSITGHLANLNFRLCDNNIDSYYFKLCGVQCDMLFRTNEKKIFRFCLTNFNAEDKSEITLYPKIVETVEDKVIDIKWVEFSRTAACVEDKEEIPVNLDSLFLLRIGKLQILFLFKLFIDVYKYADPLINREGITHFIKYYTKSVYSLFENCLKKSKININVDIHGPTLIIPDKLDSCDLLVFNLGNIKVDNLFKSVKIIPNGIIENILVEVGPFQFNRATVKLEGNIETQSDIIEPFTVKVDMKRSRVSPCRDILSFDVSVNIKSIDINLEQNDLHTIVFVFTENIGDIQTFISNFNSRPLTPINTGSPAEGIDESVGNLHAFLLQSSDIFKTIDIAATLDGITLTLYNEADEAISSPVRDPGSSLCEIEIGEVESFICKYNDRSFEIRSSFASLSVVDTRTESHSIVKKVFTKCNKEKLAHTGFSINSPPILDLTYKQSSNNDAVFDIAIEKIRLNLSINFIYAVFNYISESLPDHSEDLDFQNKIGLSDSIGEVPTSNISGLLCRPPSSAESTSGYHSTVISSLEDSKVLSLSVKIKRPEIALFIDPDELGSRIIVVHCDISIDYSRHPGTKNFHSTIDGFHVFASNYPLSGERPYSVIEWCDIDCAWTCEEGTKAEITLPSLNISLSTPIVHILCRIFSDINSYMSVESSVNLDFSSADKEDMWSPKALTNMPLHYKSRKECFYKPKFQNLNLHERCFIKLPHLSITFEKQYYRVSTPVFLLKSSMSIELQDWSCSLKSKAELQLQLCYLNSEHEKWEPIIEPISINNCSSRPWQIIVCTCENQAKPIGNISKDYSLFPHSIDSNIPSKQSSFVENLDDSELSTDENDNKDNEMVVLKPSCPSKSKTMKKSVTDASSLAGYLLDSDSDTEDLLVYKISSAFSHMFSSESEGSGKDDEATADEELCEEEDLSVRCEKKSEGHSSITDAEVFSIHMAEIPQIRSREDFSQEEITSTWIFIESKDTLRFVVTPKLMTSMTRLYEDYSSKTHQCLVMASEDEPSKEIKILNEIGPKTRVSAFRETKDKTGKQQIDTLVTSKYQDRGSVPSSSSSEDNASRLGSREEEDSDDDSSLLSKIRRPPHCGKLNTDPQYDIFCPDPLKLYADISKLKLKIEVPDYEQLTVFVGKRSSNRFFQLNSDSCENRYFVIVSVEISRHLVRIVVRSPLQVLNDLPLPVNLCYTKSVIEALGCLETSIAESPSPVSSSNPFEPHSSLVTLQPDDLFSVPIFVAYNSSLYIQPAVSNHKVSEKGIWWKDIISYSRLENLTCEAKNPSEYPLSIAICNYQGCDWKGLLEVPSVKSNENRILTLCQCDGQKKLEVMVYITVGASVIVCIYSPYWIVNKTGLPITIRGSRCKVQYNSTGSDDIVLFRYKRNYPPKLKIRIIESEWSKRWNCETIGTSGLVVCEDQIKNRKYRLLCKISRSSLTTTVQPDLKNGELIPRQLQLTKIVTLMPYFFVKNLTPRPLKFMQENDKVDLWNEIQPQQCIPFWPEAENMYMMVRHRDSFSVSQKFHFNSIHKTVLRMEKGRALVACVSGVGSEDSVVITFRKCYRGDIPVRIENWCDDIFLRVHQRGLNQITLLEPRKSILYTWDDPSLPRELMWNVYNRNGNEFPAIINKDTCGCEHIKIHSLKSSAVRPHSCSGSPKVRPKRAGVLRQRARTTASSSSEEDDEKDSSRKNKNKFFTKSNASFPVPNFQRVDKMTVHWVSYRQKGQRILAFSQSEDFISHLRLPRERATVELFVGLEGIGLSLVNNQCWEVLYASVSPSPATWEIYIDGNWKVPPCLELVSWLEDKYCQNPLAKVDLKGSLQVDLEKMFMIKPFSGKLKRKKKPGLWCQLRHSRHNTYFVGEVYRLQVDNQLLNAVYPTVVYPRKETSPDKPCLEICTSFHVSNSEITIEHFSFLGQEFYLKLEKDFLLALLDLLLPYLPLRRNRTHSELKALATPLSFSLMQKYHRCAEYDTLVERSSIAGICIYFTFGFKENPSHFHSPVNDIFECFLSSVGATVTEAKDVRLSVGQLERQNVTIGEFLCEFLDHAKHQIFQQGTCQRPDDLADDIAVSAQCVMGYLEGEIFDDFPSALGSEDFKIDMSSSLLRKRASAQKSGVEGFFCGLGKGVLGLINKPALGVLDSVSLAKEALLRAIDEGHEVIARVRAPRYISPYSPMCPFSQHDAIGLNVLASVGNGRYVTTDRYFAHCCLSLGLQTSVVLITNKHVFLLERHSLWNRWEVSWKVAVSNLAKRPEIENNAVVLSLRQDEIHSQLFGDKREIQANCPQVLKFVVRCLESLMTLQMEYSSCPNMR